MNITVEPYLIKFPQIGESSLGYISVGEREKLPFEIKRIYWTYFTPENVERGNHAHFELEQILFAAAGKITVSIELISGKTQNFILDSPNIGLYIPKMSWRKMKYSHNAVQICLASKVYDENDYIRNYEIFKSLQKKHLVNQP